jgi:hypothetical protein
MGANYDLIISRGAPEKDLVEIISHFLSATGLEVAQVGKLQSLDIPDDKAILLSPPTGGWIEMAALPSAMEITLATWFHFNPVAAHVSRSVGECIHLWSLDSGYVAGYTVYLDGELAGRECIFSRKAKSRNEVMAGVPTPEQRPSKALATALQTAYDFAADLCHYSNLEVGMAALVSRFGFHVHLLDFYEATEEKIGIAVLNSKYVDVDLTDWTAILIGV